MPDSARPQDCLLCTMEEAADTVTVFRDPLWAAEVVPGFDVPGWFVLRARRHAERITGLDNAELAALPYRARDLVAAVTEVTGAAATYFLVFGENYPHYHALIAARGDDVPADRRTGDILKLRPERGDPAAAAALVPAVRRAYQAIAAGETPAPAAR
jgi:diadenosine tetraphosphate (Ap4A) HIT family hydrolase